VNSIGSERTIHTGVISNRDRKLKPQGIPDWFPFCSRQDGDNILDEARNLSVKAIKKILKYTLDTVKVLLKIQRCKIDYIFGTI